MPRRIFRSHWSILSNLWPLLNVLEMSSLSWLIKRSSLRYHPHIDPSIDRMIQLDRDARASSEQSSSADSIELGNRRTEENAQVDPPTTCTRHSKTWRDFLVTTYVIQLSTLVFPTYCVDRKCVCLTRSHFICRSLFCSVWSLIKTLEIIIYFIMTFHKKERHQ